MTTRAWTAFSGVAGDALDGELWAGRRFLEDVFADGAIMVEAAFGADILTDPSTWVWYEITEDVRQADGQRISITPIGRSDETSTAQPAGATFELDNTSGDYTAYSPASSWYPYVRRNTPVRIRLTIGDGISVRMQGYATGWTPTWDTSGNLPVVKVQVQGITRRLSQGGNVKRSALWRFHMLSHRYPVETNTTGYLGSGQGYHGLPTHYWPLEDAAEALQAVDEFGADSGLKAGTGSYSELPKFANRTVGAGTLPIAVFEAGHNLRADFTPAPLGASQNPMVTTTGLRVPFLFNLPAIPTAAVEVARLLTDGTVGRVSLFLELFSPTIMMFKVRVYDQAGTEVGVTSNLNDNAAIGTDVWISLELNQDGADAKIGMASSVHSSSPQNGTALNTANSRSVTVAGHTVDAVKTIWLAPNSDLPSIAIGHLGLYNGGEGTFPSVAPRAVRGRAGDLADVRMRRLCIENNIPLEVIGDCDTTMGPQGVDSILPLLRDCEATDQGVMHDGRGPGLTYVTRNARYNADPTLTLDMAADQPQVGDPFEPVDDDQRNRNFAKVDRRNGGSKTYGQPDGQLGTEAIGDYETTLTVNPATEDVLTDYGSWLVHLGTWEGFRYPRLNLDLAAVPDVAADWLAAAVASRIDVTNVTNRAPQHPGGDVRLLLEGWSEQLSPHDWTAQGNTSQFDPWRVGILDQAGYLDCGACTVAEELDTTETGIDVAIADECTWTHADGDYNVLVDGEEMTVTAVSAPVGSGSSWTQTLTVIRSVNGVVRSHSVGAEVHVAEPLVLAL